MVVVGLAAAETADLVVVIAVVEIVGSAVTETVDWVTEIVRSAVDWVTEIVGLLQVAVEIEDYQPVAPDCTVNLVVAEVVVRLKEVGVSVVVAFYYLVEVLF